MRKSCSRRSREQLLLLESCILSLLHKGVYLCISHQSDCSIGVCISHQPYHSIWISCTNHGFFANDVLELGGCAQSMTLTKNSGLI